MLLSARTHLQDHCVPVWRMRVSAVASGQTFADDIRALTMLNIISRHLNLSTAFLKTAFWASSGPVKVFQNTI